MENRIGKKSPNRLINEKSPYLLQHAYNPVDWYPWGDEAFNKAKLENKLIFLSIGYSTCHWCHVMEKECFEDEEVARLLNETFICIKVDREERPDLDATYIAVCQALGRNCGWPLHILMTPKMNPFFAASYIPKTSARGSIGMMELIPQVTQIWKMQKMQLEITGADIKSRLEAMEKRTPDRDLGEEILKEAYELLAKEYDEENGGFGRAPKFPRPHSLIFLLRYWKKTGNKNALEMATTTLRKMRLGGIFDQIGFGFHRYSTDAEWLIPHFEKMLYDQALLALAYTEAYQATGAGKFRLTAKETLEYVLGDLISPEGAFYSAEDADSEGEEGKFYLWTMEEIVKILPPEDADLAVHLFGLSQKGNYLDPAVGNTNGKNILHLPTPLEDIASYKGLTLDELIGRLGRIQNMLINLRNKRVHPSMDKKVLTDWNGLMIAALARASQVFGEEKYLDAAGKAADFLLQKMRREDGTLCHRYFRGETAIDAFLDDYAFLTYGLIELYEASFQERFLEKAATLTQTMIEKFWDKENGGFFFTNKKPESGMPRMKQVYDGAVPSGNSVAMLNLLRLSFLTNNVEYERMAKQLLRTFSQEVQGAPEAYTFLLIGLSFVLGPSNNVVLVGDAEKEDTKMFVESLRKQYLPNTVLSIRSPSKSDLAFTQIDGKTTAYVCRGKMCLPPTNSVSKMLEQLNALRENS